MLNVVDIPIHALGIPVITAGIGLTDMPVVTLQPEPIVYIMVAVPGPSPVIMPLSEPIVATDVLLLLHVPPPDAGSKSVAVEAWQIVVVPDMAEANALTVTVTCTLQPEAKP